ncbi:hypothetical protein AYO21_04156 [Fonsecaea monophora]|uniref:NADH:ubiquinone oxidoreductase intermediate-associated protein 30 domain-containing protein n=1 Tax=Fonsecaea monophora TaxID=254056 RepID=A0A177FE28_9EURO|nr:hypothetical protein AYO21_04156 [Fonsecaea monophora]OAG41692.1 hypothetical protein AYO21_04156 [Fonsecaea monophora]
MAVEGLPRDFRGWRLHQWTSSDDRVRGGKSQSFLESRGTAAYFHGTLDITALGGAGFASQRTVGEDQHWNLESFAGIEVSIDLSRSDDNVYTLILKDELLPPNASDGREQATVSWEYDFSKSKCRPFPQIDSSTTTTTSSYQSVFVPWDHFKPTYRGKLVNTPKSLDLSNIKRVSIMIRSFFGSQHGDFHVRVLSLVAVAVSSTKPARMPSTVAGNASGHQKDAQVATTAAVSGNGRRDGE